MSSQKVSKRPGKIVILVILGLVMVIGIFPRGKTIYELNMRKSELLQQKQETEMRGQVLNERLQKIDEPEEIEKMAREKLGMVKPGERYIIPMIGD